MNKFIENIKKNSKHINWKAFLWLTGIMQIGLPAVYMIYGYFADEKWDWLALIICTVFCCIFNYPIILKLIFIGKYEEPEKELTGKCPTCGRPWL